MVLVCYYYGNTIGTEYNNIHVYQLHTQIYTSGTKGHFTVTILKLYSGITGEDHGDYNGGEKQLLDQNTKLTVFASVMAVI